MAIGKRLALKQPQFGNILCENRGLNGTDFIAFANTKGERTAF
jgi:hypothetical protein